MSAQVLKDFHELGALHAEMHQKCTAFMAAHAPNRAHELKPLPPLFPAAEPTLAQSMPMSMPMFSTLPPTLDELARCQQSSRKLMLNSIWEQVRSAANNAETFAYFGGAFGAAMVGRLSRQVTTPAAWPGAEEACKEVRAACDWIKAEVIPDAAGDAYPRVLHLDWSHHEEKESGAAGGAGRVGAADY